MYCSNCGQQLSDDVKFCSNCGKDPRVAVQTANAEPIIWETCDITLEHSGTLGIATKYRLVANAVGPNGKYNPFNGGPEIAVPNHLDAYTDSAGNLMGKEALDSIIKALTEEGWESLGKTGQYWFSWRFHRSAKIGEQVQTQKAMAAGAYAKKLFDELKNKNVQFKVTRFGNIQVNKNLNKETLRDMRELFPFFRNLIDPSIVIHPEDRGSVITPGNTLSRSLLMGVFLLLGSICVLAGLPLGAEQGDLLLVCQGAIPIIIVGIIWLLKRKDWG